MSQSTAIVTPADNTDVCGEENCTNDELLAQVNPDTDRPARVLCPRHRVEFLRQVSNNE